MMTYTVEESSKIEKTEKTEKSKAFDKTDVEEVFFEPKEST